MIKIIDDFFDKDVLNEVQKHITTKIVYTPSWFDGIKEKKYFYGERFLLENLPELQDLFVKQANNKFKLKIKNLNRNTGIDLRNLDEFKPHRDNTIAKINILIMLHGPIALTNGTVFYTEDKLDIHVGFRPNRAVLFPSNCVHSPHASNIKNMRRYTATLFVNDYEDL